jgi:acyl-CoA thioester hydrolase
MAPPVHYVGSAAMARLPFKYSARTRVGFSDTDAQGIVYYGRYNPYFDLARVEYLRSLGLLRYGGGGDFVMRANDVEYFAPARFDDLLEVFVRVERIGTTSITYDHAAYRVGEDGESDTLMATAKATLVCIDLGERRPVPVPAAFRHRIGRFEEAVA